MNILMIGGTGVLSTAVTNEAIKCGIHVTLINRGNRASLIPQGVELIKSDKEDFQRIAESLNGRQFEAVIDYLCYTDEQLEKSFNFYSKYTKQYFFISSCAVYNNSLGGICKEDSPKVLPVWSYSVNKWKSEELLMKLAENSQTSYTVVRPCVTYGDTRIPYGISPVYGYHWTLVARILNRKPIIRWNGGENRTNIMRVEDFAVGVVGLIGNSKAYNEAFNICGDETPSFNEVLDVLSKLTGKQVLTVDVTSDFYAQQVPYRAGEIFGRSIDGYCSNEKIKSIVPQFRCSIPLERGIKMTCDAYKNNNYQYGIDWFFDAECDRVIKKWCRQEKISTKNYNLRFIDYLGNATFKNKEIYYLELFRGNLLIKALKFFLRKTKMLKNKTIISVKAKDIKASKHMGGGVVYLPKNHHYILVMLPSTAERRAA